MENLRFSYENLGEEDVEIRITLLTSNGKVQLCTSYCAAGAIREEVIHISAALGVDFSSVTGVEISFENVVLTDTGTVLANDRTIAISDLWFDIR